jgi:DNA-binding NtrC family response regulator
MSKKAIVCVDDEAIILLSLKQEIRDHFGDRFVYETAMDGEDALEIIKELEKDGIRTILMITDWLMPRMKGDDLIAFACQLYPGIKGILITGQADHESISKIKTHDEIITCIDKPWRHEDLIDAIERAVSE